MNSQDKLKLLVSKIHENLKRSISDTQEETNIPNLYIQNEPEQLILDIQDEPEQNNKIFTEDWIGLGKPKNKMKKSKYIPNKGPGNTTLQWQ